MRRTSVALVLLLAACGDDASVDGAGAGTSTASGVGQTSANAATNATSSTANAASTAQSGGTGGAEPRDGVDVHLDPQEHDTTLLFDPDVDQLNTDYHSFRIPSIVRTTKGTLIAFAEGRVCTGADYGNINLVYKRSFDDGKTWEPLKEVVGAGQGTWGNPTAVVDAATEEIFVFMSWNAENRSQFGDPDPCDGSATTAVGPGDRPVKLSRSTNDGDSFSAPDDLTDTLQPAGMEWDAMGPGVGIQTTVGPTAGRLVIPAINRNIYSDDHGMSWAFAPIPGGSSEGTVVELSTGELMRNDRVVRSVWLTGKRRWTSTGTIEGGFPDFAPHDELIDPRAQGSAIRYSTNPHRIVFLNAASTVEADRCPMHVRISYDDGKTWPMDRQLHDDLSPAETCTRNLGGYSSMARTADDHIVALSERTEPGAGNHRGIEAHRFNLSFVVDGEMEPN